MSTGALVKVSVVGSISITSNGRPICFYRKRRRWYATVDETFGLFSRTVTYPVLCPGDLQSTLPRLLHRLPPGRWIRLHEGAHSKAIIIGAFGLFGGGDDAERIVPSALFKFLTDDRIDSTMSLVEELNADRSLEEKRILLEWVQGYIAWFSRQPSEILTISVLHEYSHLAAVQSTDAVTGETIHRWFCSLCSRLHRESYDDGKFVEAVDFALQSIDRRIFRDDPSLLIRLANDLLSKLDPAVTAFTRETYPTHSTLLFALHRTVMTMEHVASRQLDPHQEDGLYQKFRRRLMAIGQESGYYPCVYCVRLIESSLQRTMSESKGPGRHRALSGALGALYIIKGLRSLFSLDFDVEAFEHGLERLHEAFTALRIQKASWYDWMQALGNTALSTFVRAGNYNNFDACYRVMKKEVNEWRRSENRTALRFGMVLQLRMLAVHGVNDDIRNRSTTELISLAEGCKTDDGWIDDPEIVEALMDALVDVYRTHPAEHISVALELLMSVENVDTQKVVNAWLRHGSIEERVKGHPDAATQSSSQLFGIVRKELMSIVSESVESSPSFGQMRRQLVAFYQRPQFTKMEPLFEGEPELHIVSVQCQLMLLEQKKIKEDDSEEEEPISSDDREHHLCSHHERLEWVKTAISQAALFTRRCLEPDAAEAEIRRVLITGDPGTGKTTLARHLAFGWASGEWGREFGCVFFLQVRELQASKYNDANDRREETLATAVVNSCFPRQDKDAFVRLRRQVQEVLKDPSTLVILDGLDESAGASHVIIDEAKNGNHKLLMLARPYGVQNDRSLADIEVVLSGLNDAQLEELIETELPQKQARALLNYIRDAPAIWNIAHIPVNATILCTLWKDPSSFKHSASGSLSVLYRRMTHFTWERYMLKTKQENNDVIEVFDTLGRIAYEALMQGQILIDEWLVLDHARTSQMKRILKESGFLLLQAVGLHYQFLHLTFQEYFAGRWLARQFCRGTIDEIAAVEEILVRQKYDAALKVVFSFMMGEVSLMRGAKGAERMMEQINRQPRDVVGIQHLLLELKLINDHLAVKMGRERPNVDVVDRLMELLRSCSGEYTLVSLLVKTLEVLPSLVQSYPEVLDPLMEMCEWPCRFRAMAFKAIAILLAFVPDRLNIVVDHMESLFCRSDERVREEIVRFMTTLLPAFGDRYRTLLPLIKIACVDKKHSIRQSAMKSVSALMPYVSDDDAAILIDKLTTGCNDELYTVRRSALISIGTVIEMESHHSLVLLKATVTMLWDPYEHVRDIATDVCKRAILDSKDAAKMVTEALISATQDTNWSVAQYAFEAIGKLLPSMPNDRSTFVDVVSNGMDHRSSSVREAVITTIAIVIRLDPAMCPRLLPSIECGLDATEYVVRKASIKSLTDVAEHCSETDLERIEAHLLKAFSDREFLVRLATVEAVGEVTRRVPDRIDAYISSLKSSSKDEVYTVRKASIEVFGDIAMRRGTQAEALVETLTTACNDPFTHVRKSSLECIGRLLQRSPEYLERCMDALRDYGRRNIHGRKGAVDTVAELLRLAPERMPELVEYLTEAFDDPDHHVQVLLLQTLGSIDHFPESRISQLASKFFASCLHEAPIVRNLAVEKTKALLKKHPEASRTIFDTVRKTTADHNNEHRRVAFSVMGALLRCRPDLIPTCIPLIRRGCRDEINFIREAAMVVVQTVMEIDRMAFSKLMDLVSAARDGLSRVRAAAVKLIDVAMDVAPDVFEALLDQAVDGCSDRSFFVRKCAFQLVDKAIVKRPELIPTFLPSLLEAFHHPHPQQRHNSKDVIRKIPLETLMECYWDAPWKEGLAFELVSRLYQTPLTISRSMGRWSLILHRQATRAIEWEKTEEEVRGLVDMLRDIHEQRLDST